MTFDKTTPGEWVELVALMAAAWLSARFSGSGAVGSLTCFAAWAAVWAVKLYRRNR